MLGKTMKYEFKSGARQLLPFFGIALATAGALRLVLLIGGMFSEFVYNILLNITTGLGSLLIIAVILIAIAITVMRFYKSMSANEAYLTFTLPVGPSTHLFARLISGAAFVLLGFVTAILCGAVFLPGFFNSMGVGLSTIQVNGETVQVASGVLTSSTKAALFGSVAVFIVLLSFIILVHLYTAVAIGTQFGRNRLVGSVVGYFIINTAQSVLSIPIMLIAMFTLLGSDAQQLEASFAQWFSPLLAATDPNAFAMQVLQFVWVVFGFVLVYQLVITIIEFCAMRHLFTKRLNLE